MDLLNAVRNKPRFPIRWPTVYEGEDFIGQGTILELSLRGCRVAGTMPPDPGVRLSLCLYPGHPDREIYVEEARVKWITDELFWAEFIKTRTEDLQWLIGYLDRAERRYSLRHLLGMHCTTHTWPRCHWHCR